MTAEQRLRQAYTKQRIVIARRVRAAGTTGCLEGYTDREVMTDALRRAYEAGVRDGRAA